MSQFVWEFSPLPRPLADTNWQSSGRGSVTRTVTWQDSPEVVIETVEDVINKRYHPAGYNTRISHALQNGVLTVRIDRWNSCD